MSITKEQVFHALGHVDDPDLKKDLVTLGMIKDIEITDNKVSFSVVLTTPACPMKDMIQNACINAIHHFIDKGIEVEANMTSNVTTGRDEISDVLPGVKNIIAVASGKGGVGKSTTTVNLALGLAREGAKVGIIDADIYGPSIPTMFGLTQERPGVEEIDGKPCIIPLEKHGVKIMSLGFMVAEDQPVVWRGAMVSKALKQFFSDCHWGELDYLLLDLPPGTGDIQLTLAQSVPITGSLIVTTPQQVALIDVKKSISMFKLEGVEVPVLGIVENMSWFTPAELPENKYYIFGKDGGQNMAKELNLPFFGGIPLVQGIREGGDFGSPIVLEEDHPASKEYVKVAKSVAQEVAMLNAKKLSTVE